MIPSHLDTIITALNADSGVLSVLGGAYCEKFDTSDPMRLPVVKVKMANDTSEPCLGYTSSKRADCTSYLSIDIWTARGGMSSDGDNIEAAVDRVLRGAPVPTTRDWMKLTRSQMWDKDRMTWHTVTRWSYEYNIYDI